MLRREEKDIIEDGYFNQILGQLGDNPTTRNITKFIEEDDDQD